MPEQLVTGDGKALPLGQGEEQFAAAMAAPEPGARPDYPAPRKRRDPDAPFGYEEDGVTPKAPHGFGANGKPRQNPPGPGRGGRKDGPKPQRSPKPVVTLEPRDYATDLAEGIDGLWAGLAFLPPTQAQATILKANKAGLVAGANLSAQHNPYVRRGVEYFCSDASWMINAAMLVGPFTVQSLALWFRPAQMQKICGASKDELAEIARKDLADFMASQQQALGELLEESRQAGAAAA